VLKDRGFCGKNDVTVNYAGKVITEKYVLTTKVGAVTLKLIKKASKFKIQLAQRF
jgi:hypothetical protein